MILSPDKPLFHYTNLDGLLGILNGDDLWLTHSRYSNDEEEFTHGLTVVKEVLSTTKSLNIESARLLLSEIGHGNLRVTASPTPYRG